MDDFDDERFSRPALSSAPAASPAGRAAATSRGTGHRRVDGNREEQRTGDAASSHTIRVRVLEEHERGRIQQEAQLLAALEVAGVTAAPAVLELEDEGYVRETAPVLVHRGGRRVSETGTPPTGERRAVARARESLDALIGALHERGWVLGARHGGGLGARADGSVLVLDLHGLRRDESLSARQDDRRWVDSVLQDQDRTLRRRVHLERARTARDALVPGGAPFPQGPQDLPEPASARSSQESPHPALPNPRRRRRVATEPLRRSSVAEEVPGRHAAAPARSAVTERVQTSLQEVLGQPRLRLTAVLSGALVLLLGAVVGLGAWWAQDRDVANREREQPAAASPAELSPAPAPSIEEPQLLVAELAGSRHAYVTGISDRPVSAPGSAALAEDEHVRDSYEGITVSAGGPVVHSAEVLEQPDSEDDSGDTAELRAVTSMQELRLQDTDGSTSTVPATAPMTVRLLLEWDGRQWCIVGVEQLGTTAEADAP